MARSKVEIPKMKAVVFDRGLRLAEMPVPKPASGEALVKVRMAGVCDTDLKIVQGYMGFTGVLGHEFVGTVEKSADRGLIHKRVVGEINAGCGKCELCRQGLVRHCPTRTVLGIVGRNGAFAQYLTLPNLNLHVVPDNVPDEIAVFTEPVAAACEILEQGAIKPGTEVLVIGAGRIGTLSAQILTLAGAAVTATARNPKRRPLLESLGLEFHTPDKLGSRKFDLIVEASGSPDGFLLALDRINPRGTLILKSTYVENLTFQSSRLVIDEITVVGSRCGPFKPALDHLSRGTVRVREMIEAIYPLDRGVEALEHAKRPGALKVLIRVE